MKGGTIQINWHGSDPVLTVDFHRLTGLLATGGADHDIKLWTLKVSEDATLPSADFHSSLSYHTSAVNVVRFSATGDQLASGADGGEILLWKLNDNNDASNLWKLSKNLRFHMKDVLDLQWSLDGTLLISGSVDNTVILWDAVKGNPHQILKDHIHYVQGVAWDPIGQYIASISGDRTCRVYCSKIHNPKSKSQDKNTFSCQSVLVKADLPKQEEDAETSKTSAGTTTAPPKQNLFHDETLGSFFRRLEWSPDGSFLLVPAGIHKFPSESTLTNTAFIISRKDLSRPAMQLPGASKPIVAVRFCPLVFTLNPNLEQTTCMFNLPYRIIFAVASMNSIYIYDTQSISPLAILAGIHYAAITDIAWSWDAKYLAVSSQDGFCSLVAFDPEELGPPIASSDLPAYIAEFLPIAKEVTTMVQLKSSHSTEKVQNRDSNGNSLHSQSVKHKKDFDEKGNGQPEVQEQNRKGMSENGERTPKVVPQDAAPVNASSQPKRITPIPLDVASVNPNSQPKRITPIPQDLAAVHPKRIAPIPQEAASVKPKRITPIVVNVESGNNVATDTTMDAVMDEQQKESKDVTANEHGGNESMEIDSSVGTSVTTTEEDSGLDKKTQQHLSGGPMKQRRITPVADTAVRSVQAACGTELVNESNKAVPISTIDGNTVVDLVTETGGPVKQKRITPIAITSSDPEKQGSDDVNTS